MASTMRLVGSFSRISKAIQDNSSHSEHEVQVEIYCVLHYGKGFFRQRELDFAQSLEEEYSV